MIGRLHAPSPQLLPEASTTETLGTSFLNPPTAPVPRKNKIRETINKKIKK
jgi:hypothetical protein